MRQPTCEEIKSLHDDIMQSKSDFETLHVLAEEFGYRKDKDYFRNAVAGQRTLESLMAKYKTEIFPWTLTDFEGKKLHRFEAEALDEIIDAINEDIAKRQPLKSFDPDTGMTIRRPFRTRKFLESRIDVTNGSVDFIDLTAADLQCIPQSVNRLPLLEGLALSSNSITQLIDLKPLKKLKKLSVAATLIKDIASLDGMEQLEELNVTHCPIDRTANAERIEYWQKKLGNKFQI